MTNANVKPVKCRDWVVLGDGGFGLGTPGITRYKVILINSTGCKVKLMGISGNVKWALRRNYIKIHGIH